MKRLKVGTGPHYRWRNTRIFLAGILEVLQVWLSHPNHICCSLTLITRFPLILLPHSYMFDPFARSPLPITSTLFTRPPYSPALVALAHPLSLLAQVGFSLLNPPPDPPVPEALLHRVANLEGQLEAFKRHTTEQLLEVRLSDL